MDCFVSFRLTCDARVGTSGHKVDFIWTLVSQSIRMRSLEGYQAFTSRVGKLLSM